PVGACPSTTSRGRTPLAASSLSCQVAESEPTRPSRRTSTPPRRAAQQATLAPAPPGTARITAGGSVPEASGPRCRATTSVITSPTTSSAPSRTVPSLPGGPGRRDACRQAYVAPDRGQVRGERGAVGATDQMAEQERGDPLPRDPLRLACAQRLVEHPRVHPGIQLLVLGNGVGHDQRRLRPAERTLRPHDPRHLLR